MRFVDDPECGSFRSFEDAHIYFVLSVLNEEPMSRSNLSDMTGIGEGCIRRIIGILKDMNAVEVKRSGVTITKRGRIFLEKIPIRPIPIERSDYALGTYQQGILIKDAAEKVTDGMCQRDTGISAGANGASVFLMRNGEIIMPMDWNMDERDPKFADQLKNNGMKDGDVIVISGASDHCTAKISAIAIALDLL